MGFLVIITATSPKTLTIETTLSNYLLIVDAYSKNPKLYGIKELILRKKWISLICVQARFEKVDDFVW